MVKLAPEWLATWRHSAVNSQVRSIKKSYAMRRCLFFAIFVLALTCGDCLKCYMCTSANDTHCEYPKENQLRLRDCNSETIKETKQFADHLGSAIAKWFETDDGDVFKKFNDDKLYSCFKQVTKLGNKEITFRGCQLTPNEQQDLCKVIKETAKDFVKHCSLCPNDACNATPFSVVPLHFLILLVPAMLLNIRF